MPKNSIVMPTLKRTEMLALSLERLRAALPEKFDADVTIYLDTTGSRSETEFVRDTYFPTAQIFHQEPHLQAPSGCWNILNALKGGYDSGADYVYLIEEDVMVYPQYFIWHRTFQEPYVPSMKFAACGRWPNRYGSIPFYTNPGACLSRGLLGCVVPHICDAFFKDRKEYMNSVFGIMDEASDLDDGLVRRVIRSVNAKVYYPALPIVAHQGYRAYRRFADHTNEGTIEERILNLRRMLETVNPKERYTQDFEPYDSARKTEELSQLD